MNQSDDFLYRQVHPDFVRQGEITSQVFRPTPKDRGKLSMYDGRKTTAAGSWTHYTIFENLESIGTMAVTEQECTDLDLDVLFDGIPFPEHVSVDFRGHSNSQVERKAKRLKKLAIERGWQFGPTHSSASTT